MKKILLLAVCTFLLITISGCSSNKFYSNEYLENTDALGIPKPKGTILNSEGYIFYNGTKDDFNKYVSEVYSYIISKDFKCLGTREGLKGTSTFSLNSYYLKETNKLEDFLMSENSESLDTYCFVYSNSEPVLTELEELCLDYVEIKIKFYNNDQVLTYGRNKTFNYNSYLIISSPPQTAYYLKKDDLSLNDPFSKENIKKLFSANYQIATKKDINNLHNDIYGKTMVGLNTPNFEYHAKRSIESTFIDNLELPIKQVDTQDKYSFEESLNNNKLYSFGRNTSYYLNNLSKTETQAFYYSDGVGYYHEIFFNMEKKYAHTYLAGYPYPCTPDDWVYKIITRLSTDSWYISDLKFKMAKENSKIYFHLYYKEETYSGDSEFIDLIDWYYVLDSNYNVIAWRNAIDRSIKSNSYFIHDMEDRLGYEYSGKFDVPNLSDFIGC